MLIAYRHPKPAGAAGRCIGARTDLRVDPRKAKRLAHRIRARQRREGLAREVWTSDLQRAAAVGRWLRRWGWRQRIDARLRELDFGAWDGQRWADIPPPEIHAWSENLAGHRPGGDGETVTELLARVAEFGAASLSGLLVTHGGWLSAWQWLRQGVMQPPTAALWPRAPGYAQPG